MRRNRRNNRKGFSLLEVILAIAILGGSMVVIGYGYYLGYRSVRNARMIGMGNRIADSAMTELAAGVIEPVSASNRTIPSEPDWTYSVQIDKAAVPGLLTAVVSVENNEFTPKVNVAITRLIPDPDYDGFENSEE
jgi:prepilin-type N-terminal cleavage/methylation domain-containing protein